MRRRLSVFLNLMKAGRADNLSLDIDNSDTIIKLLDAGKKLMDLDHNKERNLDIKGILSFCKSH